MRSARGVRLRPDAAVASRELNEIARTPHDVARARQLACSAYAAIALLAGRFPHAFMILETRRRPLKVGIFSEVAAAVNGAVEPHELRAAFHAYTDNSGYSRSVRSGAAGVDLDGNAAGVVSAPEAARAAERLAAELLRAANRKPASRRRAQHRRQRQDLGGSRSPT